MSPYEIISVSGRREQCRAARRSGRFRRVRDSLHMQGKAIDVRFERLFHSRAARCALRLAAAASVTTTARNFVHVDTGRPRRWKATKPGETTCMTLFSADRSDDRSADRIECLHDFPWYAHLRNLSDRAWYVAAFASWGIASLIPAAGAGEPDRVHRAFALATEDPPGNHHSRSVCTFRVLLHAQTSETRLSLGMSVHARGGLLHFPRAGYV